MNTFSKLVLAMFFITSLGLAVFARQSIKDVNNPETIPATDSVPAKDLRPGNTSPDAFCTMDIKICPDGSAVSRDPLNNCEFKQCPAAIENVICGNGVCESGEDAECEDICTTVNGKVLCSGGTCEVTANYCPEDCITGKKIPNPTLDLDSTLNTDIVTSPDSQTTIELNETTTDKNDIYDQDVSNSSDNTLLKIDKLEEILLTIILGSFNN